MTTALLEERQQKQSFDSSGIETDQNMDNFLFDIFRPTVVKIAKFVKAHCSIEIPFNDLISVGMFGLSKALAQYEQEPKGDLKMICEENIRCAMIDAVRYAAWLKRQDI